MAGGAAAEAVPEVDPEPVPSPGGGGPGRPVMSHTGQRQSWTVEFGRSYTCSTRSVRPHFGQWPIGGGDEFPVVSGLLDACELPELAEGLEPEELLDGLDWPEGLVLAEGCFSPDPEELEPEGAALAPGADAAPPALAPAESEASLPDPNISPMARSEAP